MAQHPVDDSTADGDWKFPLMLSFLAGASTSIGAGIVFVFSPAVIKHSMPFSLSLAASVMITVSVISIGPECLHGVVILSGEAGEIEVHKSLLLLRIISFGLGCLSYFLLSKLLVMLPEPQTFMNTPKSGKIAADDHLQVELDDASPKRTEVMPNNVLGSDGNSRGAVRRAAANRESQLTLSSSFSAGSLESMASSGGTTKTLFDEKNGEKQKLLLAANSSSSEERRRSWRVAMLLFVSLLCHNFPEGLAVVASTAESRELGVTVAIGIMIHNIPEGIAIAVPCMAARPDAPWLAFWLATLSGIAEPLGAVLALVVLRSSSSHSIQLPLENILAFVAGIMCMVAIIELYPEALNHVKQKNYRGIVWGSLLGMLIMVATEWYLP
jgi:ZIP family zinc transporter